MGDRGRTAADEMLAFVRLAEVTTGASRLNLNATTGRNVTTNEKVVDNGEWDVVTDDFRLVFQVVNFVFICQIIDLFGTGTNIVNIICFVKQGLRDPVNISLLGLAISDLLSLVTLIWHNISVNPLLYYADIPFDSQDTVYLTAGIPHIGFTRVTSWITAFITLERCLCIVFPLKIRTIITPNRVKIVIVTIFIIIFFGDVVPVYYCTRFGMQRSPYRNKTWLGLAFTRDRPTVDRFSFAINNCFLPFAAFTLISVSTITLVVKLRSKTKWREKSASLGQAGSISKRDQSVSKIVVMISTVFIACYTPVCVIFIGMIVVPTLSIDGTFGNMFGIVFSFAYILEAINASFNIFIYYTISSKYREVFRQTFCWKQDRTYTSN